MLLLRSNMRRLLVPLLCTILATSFGPAAADYGYTGNGVPLGLIIILVCWIAFGLIIPCIMFSKLEEQDDQLPAQKRFLDENMVMAYWFVCFSTGCTGSVVFYLVASSEIERRVVALASQKHSPVDSVPTYGQPITIA